MAKNESFCAREEKKIENKKNEKSHNGDVLNNQCLHKPVQVRICVPAQNGLWGYKLSLRFDLIKIS